AVGVKPLRHFEPEEHSYRGNVAPDIGRQPSVGRGKDGIPVSSVNFAVFADQRAEFFMAAALQATDS
ncbi:MAG: hypothetical protein CO013_00195, partial [Syntrophobacterales bacterium CG_4_8_14_3_um_filter_58_8]